MSVAVEIGYAAMAGHHQSMKEIQYLEVYPNAPQEKTRITITNVDSGTMNIIMIATNLTATVTATVPVNCTATQLYNTLNNWYVGNIGSWISVTRTMYDSSGNVTTDLSLMVSSMYEITLAKLIADKSVAGIQVQKTSAATVTVALPDAVQRSGTPLGGKF